MTPPIKTTSSPKLLHELSCSILRGVGAKTEQALAKKSIYTIQDLLFHLPYRYQDRTQVTPIADLKEGEYAVIEGAVYNTKVSWGKRPNLQCQIIDDSEKTVNLSFFNFYAAQQNQLRQGVKLRCFGEVRRFRDQFSMIHPELTFFQQGESAVEETLTPVYPSTEGISQSLWRKLLEQALAYLAEGAAVEEYLPQALREQYQLEDSTQAITYLHHPPPEADIPKLLAGSHPMQQRLALEELVAHQISMRSMSTKIQQYTGVALAEEDNLTQAFLTQLPFQLTAAQQRVLQEINHDLGQPKPMLRLVQGDVGCGKTVVAAIAMLRAIAQGHQAALMAPTELLAEQHYRNFCQWFAPLGMEVMWLSGKLTSRQRQDVLAFIGRGIVPVVVGTHALLQEDVLFQSLALVIIDEQHRFGVHQRLTLRDKALRHGHYPHQLVMTATPIPRTLAMTAYADMDYSVIDELPPGRKPITTVAVANSKREDVIARVRSNCLESRQAYWVCTLIDESEALRAQAAEVTAYQLQEQLSELRIGLVHGRMGANDKEQIMASFKAGDIDLLVATTVIEVGVDVPNASLMIIENPERLGLAQLHQLRGRVGRGAVESHCVLLYQAPLSQTAKARIGILRETNDGFAIAEEDLKLRGPGELLGTRQTGIAQFRIADLTRDAALLDKATELASELLEKHPEVAKQLTARWHSHNEDYVAV